MSLFDSPTPAAGSANPAGVGAPLVISVYGTPAPQGSHKAFVRGNRAIVTNDSAKTRPWREAVKWAALEHLHGTPALQGPVAVRMVFTVPKPKSAPKRTRTWPSKRPDWDKLARSTGDALTDAAVYGDDAQVVEAAVRKVYPGEDPEALATPGAVITVWPVVA